MALLIKPGELIAGLVKLRDEKRALAKKLKELEDEYKMMEQTAMALSRDLGVDRLSHNGHTFSRLKALQAFVEDWDAYHDHIRETGELYLLNRSASVSSLVELYQSQQELPPGSKVVEIEKAHLTKSTK